MGRWSWRHLRVHAIKEQLEPGKRRGHLVLHLGLQGVGRGGGLSLRLVLRFLRFVLGFEPGPSRLKPTVRIARLEPARAKFFDAISVTLSMIYKM